MGPGFFIALFSGAGNDKPIYQIADHLGSVRVIKDGNGDVLQRFDYYPFGSESKVWAAGMSTPQSALRYRFGGKEIAGQKAGASALAGIPAAAAGSPYLDFGARLYDPRTAAWLSQDPMAEKYYPIGPYVYCAGNPVNLVDPDGKTTRVVQISESSYVIVDGGNPFDGSSAIVAGYFNDNLDWIEIGLIGFSMTSVSFFNTDFGQWSVGAVLNTKDPSGYNFIASRTSEIKPLGDYMESAMNNTINDFKVTNGEEGHLEYDPYRGMPLYQDQHIYASGRDIGNYLAGYYAAVNGFSWGRTRWAFDKYQGSQEGLSTQAAQYAGYLKGLQATSLFQRERYFIKSIPSIIAKGGKILF